MSRIEWDETLSVNNAEIDEQHKKWIEIHNRLHDALMGEHYERVEKVCAETLQAMQDYVRYHFKFEEEYMRGIDYPEIVEHRRIHKDFDNRIYTYNRDIQEGRIVLSSALMKVLKNWLIDHIRHEDQKYCRFLQGTSM